MVYCKCHLLLSNAVVLSLLWLGIAVEFDIVLKNPWLWPQPQRVALVVPFLGSLEGDLTLLIPVTEGGSWRFGIVRSSSIARLLVIRAVAPILIWFYFERFGCKLSSSFFWFRCITNKDLIYSTYVTFYNRRLIVHLVPASVVENFRYKVSVLLTVRRIDGKIFKGESFFHYHPLCFSC